MTTPSFRPLQIPMELALALSKTSSAAEGWARTPLHGQVAYIRWVGKARRQKVRSSRAASTAEWAAEGTLLAHVQREETLALAVGALLDLLG